MKENLETITLLITSIAMLAIIYRFADMYISKIHQRKQSLSEQSDMLWQAQQELRELKEELKTIKKQITKLK